MCYYNYSGFLVYTLTRKGRNEPLRVAPYRYHVARENSSPLARSYCSVSDSDLLHSLQKSSRELAGDQISKPCTVHLVPCCMSEVVYGQPPLFYSEINFKYTSLSIFASSSAWCSLYLDISIPNSLTIAFLSFEAKLPGFLPIAKSIDAKSKIIQW